MLEESPTLGEVGIQVRDAEAAKEPVRGQSVRFGSGRGFSSFLVVPALGAS